jgi:glycosyltransferase involved in cell wall biosynthesis
MICCFNEKRTILKAIEEAKAINIDKEIIVIDNCSTDGTKEILQGLKEDKELQIVFHPKNFGANYSGREGAHLARGDYFYSPGADLEYKMDDVCRMMEEIENGGLDAVFGSRLLDRKGVSKISLIKERPFWLGSIISTFLVNLFFRRDFTDVIATKLVKTSMLKGFVRKAKGPAAGELEVVSKLCKIGCKIKEIPVWYKPRTHEEGKTIRAFDMLPGIWAILRVKLFG